LSGSWIKATGGHRSSPTYTFIVFISSQKSIALLVSIVDLTEDERLHMLTVSYSGV